MRLAGHASARTALIRSPAVVRLLVRPLGVGRHGHARAASRTTALRAPRKISPIPTPTEASIACSPKPNAKPSRVGDAVLRRAASRSRPGRAPTLPGQSGMIVATFISSSTSAAAGQRTRGCRTRASPCTPRTAGRSIRALEEDRACRRPAAGASRRGRARAMVTTRLTDAQPFERACCPAERALNRAKMKSADADRDDGDEARVRPGRDLRRGEHVEDEQADRDQVEDPMGDDGADERRPQSRGGGSCWRLSTPTRASSPIRPGRTAFAEQPDAERREDERKRGRGGGSAWSMTSFHANVRDTIESEVERDRDGDPVPVDVLERGADAVPVGPRTRGRSRRRRTRRAVRRANAPVVTDR